MKISHLISFHPMKLPYQFTGVMAPRNFVYSVYYSCCKSMNFFNLLQVGAGSMGKYNATIVYFRDTFGVDNILNCFFAHGFSHF